MTTITLPHNWNPYDWQLDVLEARERILHDLATS